MNYTRKRDNRGARRYYKGRTGETRNNPPAGGVKGTKIPRKLKQTEKIRRRGMPEGSVTGKKTREIV